MSRVALGLVLVLAGCSGEPDPANTEAPDLEAVAIERGLVRDPENDAITGLYQRGGDRLCIVPAGEGLRIGAYVLAGGRLGCSASGTARQSGNRLRIDFGATCEVEARVEGSRIVFPAKLPPACAQRCAAHGSLNGLRVERVSDVTSEAAGLRDPSGRAVCGG